MRVLPPEFPRWIHEYCERLEREHAAVLLEGSRLADLDWRSVRSHGRCEIGLGVARRIRTVFETNIGLAALFVGSNLFTLFPTTHLVTNGMCAVLRRGEMIVIDGSGRGLEVEVRSRWQLRPRRHRITIRTHRSTLHVLSNWAYTLPHEQVCVPERLDADEYAVRLVSGVADGDHAGQLRGDEAVELTDGRLPIEPNEAAALLMVLLSVWPDGGA